MFERASYGKGKAATSVVGLESAGNRRLYPHDAITSDRHAPSIMVMEMGESAAIAPVRECEPGKL